MNGCLERARNGDTAARHLLVENLRPRVAKMAAFYARQSGEDPEDLLQEAWIGLLEALPELKLHVGCPEQYLLRQARWRLLDALRRARSRRCAFYGEEPAAERLTASTWESAWASACVSDFTNRLKGTQRAVLDCLMIGLTWREAGDKLGCTSANIAYHVRQIQQQYHRWADER